MQQEQFLRDIGFPIRNKNNVNYLIAVLLRSAILERGKYFSM